MFATGGNAQQQQDPERGCRAHTSLSTGATDENIYIQRTRGNRSANGNFELTWEAWVSDDRALTGRCESDVRGTIVTFQRIGVHPGRRPNAGSAQGFGQQPYGQQQQAGHLSADTQGRGTFTGLGMSGQLNRATLTLEQGRANVTFYDGNGNRLSVMGAVTAQPRQNEFTVQIDSTDRGRNASGTMDLRVNRDANAIVSINVNGRTGREQFSGTFSR